MTETYGFIKQCGIVLRGSGEESLVEDLDDLAMPENQRLWIEYIGTCSATYVVRLVGLVRFLWTPGTWGYYGICGYIIRLRRQNFSKLRYQRITEM